MFGSWGEEGMACSDPRFIKGSNLFLGEASQRPDDIDDAKADYEDCKYDLNRNRMQSKDWCHQSDTSCSPMICMFSTSPF